MIRLEQHEIMTFVQICTREKGICKRITLTCFQQLFYYNKSEIKGGNGFHLTAHPLLQTHTFFLQDVSNCWMFPKLAGCSVVVFLGGFLRMKARAGEEVES